MKFVLKYIVLSLFLFLSYAAHAQSISRSEAKILMNRIIDKMGTSPYKADVYNKSQYKKKTPVVDEYSMEVIPNGRFVKSKKMIEIAEGHRVITIDHDSKEVSYVDWNMSTKDDPNFNNMQELLSPNNPEEVLRNYFDQMVLKYDLLFKKEKNSNTIILKSKDPNKRISYLKIVYKEASLELVNYELHYKNIFTSDFNGNPVYTNVVTKVKNINYSISALSEQLANYVTVSGNQVVMKKYKNYKLYVN